MASGAFAGVLLLNQIQDNGTWFPSYTTPDGGVYTEAADDFTLSANIDRITFGGGISSATEIQGLTVRFYSAAAGGGPGALLNQYDFTAGDPALNLRNDLVDVNLPSVFSATGRHFVSVQIVSVPQWSKGSANFSVLNPINGETVYTRADSGAWSPSTSQVDMSLTVYGTTTGAPAAGGLSTDTVTRSGYLEIQGSSFGDAGQVTVGGVPAHIAHWSNSKITVYANEATPLGINDLVVTTQFGSSAALPVTVINRSSVERIQWQFRYVGIYSSVKPVITGSGTIYATDVSGFLYAINADGSLQWVRSNTGGHGLDVGVDGTIYTVGHNGVFAFLPNGDLKWTFNLGAYLTYRIGAVAEGPDGNIYIGTAGDLGMFSLSAADGSLRWSSPIAPDVAQNDYGRIAFGDNNGKQQVLYNAWSGTYAYELNGKELFVTYGRNPIVAPNGNIYLGAYIVSPDGTFICMVNDGTSEPAVNSANKRFGVGVDLLVHDSVCNESARYSIPQYAVAVPALDNTQGTLILGASNGLAESVSYAVSTSNGAELWRQNLPLIGGQIQAIHTSAAFSSDNSSYYINTGISGALIQGFLTAIAFDSATGGTTNTAPTADNISVSTAQDASVGITLTATDPDAGDILSFALSVGSGPFFGSLSGAAPNLVYTPNAGYAGPDQFDFTVSDNSGAVSAPARVTISITAFNNAPVAADDSATVINNVDTVVNVLGNDSDVDGDSFSINSFARNKNLSISVNADQTLTIKAKRNFLGTTTFTYDIIDSVGNISAPAVVTVTSIAGN